MWFLSLAKITIIRVYAVAFQISLIYSHSANCYRKLATKQLQGRNEGVAKGA